MICAYALLSRDLGPEQHRQFTDAFNNQIDLQSYIPDVTHLQDMQNNREINVTGSELVIVSDDAPTGPAHSGGQFHLLAYTLAEQLAGPNQVRTIALINTNPLLTTTLTAELTAALQQQGKTPDEITKTLTENLIHVTPDITAIGETITNHLNLETPLTPGNPLITKHEHTKRNTGTAHTLTILGSKGGVGKTTLTHNIAFTAANLAHQDNKRCNIVVIELDFLRSKSAAILDTTTPLNQIKTITNYANNTGGDPEMVTEYLEPIRCTDGTGATLIGPNAIRFMFGPKSGTEARNLAPETIRTVITTLQRSHEIDVILIDCGPNIIDNEHVTTAIGMSNKIIVVVDQDEQTLSDLPNLIPYLTRVGGLQVGDLTVVVNKSTAPITDDGLRTQIGRYLNPGTSIAQAIPTSPAIALASTQTNTKNRWTGLLRGNNPMDRATYLAIKSLTTYLIPIPTKAAESTPKK